MEIQDNIVVGMHYTVTNDNGDIIDTSEGNDPLMFLQGAGNIIPGLESALVGGKVGDEMEVSVEPEQAYGEYRDELRQQVPRDAFQGVDEVAIGMRFNAETDEGQITVRIAEVEGDTVTIDANHELAGERLHFSVRIESLREATDEELEHGHVHGPGGHHH
jgi:FKBP-type peptidyl-prolyl cis-trans isomerase SlyD